MNAALTLRTDGGSRGNPGPAAAAYVIEDASGRVLAEHAEYLGVTTNNQAEYRALLLGLAALKHLAPARVRVLMDSELIVRQMLGDYRVRDSALKPLYDEARDLVNAFGAVHFEHVPRAQNHRADKLVNLALDAERKRANDRL